MKPNDRARIRARTIAALQGLIGDSTKPATMRRAATLRLARLTNATKPAPDAAGLLRGKQLALDTFLVLAAQRGALLRRFAKLQPAEREVLNTLLESMPESAPRAGDSAADWCDFVHSVTECLAAVKTLPKQPTNKSNQ